MHVVAARLGHSGPSITLRVYAHVIRDQLTEGGSVLSGNVSGTVRA